MGRPQGKRANRSRTCEIGAKQGIRGREKEKRKDRGGSWHEQEETVVGQGIEGWEGKQGQKKASTGLWSQKRQTVAGQHNSGRTEQWEKV